MASAAPSATSLEWKDDPSLTITIMPYESIDKDTLREIKRLRMRVLSESDKIEGNNNMIAIAYKNTGVGKRRLIGIAIVSTNSPMYHFANETKDVSRVPYLHNFVCDMGYRKMKASVSLMYAIKRFVIDNPLYTSSSINLNILANQIKPTTFFTRNGFVKVGSVGKEMPYECYTYASIST